MAQIHQLLGGQDFVLKAPVTQEHVQQPEQTFEKGSLGSETNQNAIEKESSEGRPRARRCREYNNGMRSGRVIC